jgi:hypothetical protein
MSRWFLVVVACVACRRDDGSEPATGSPTTPTDSTAPTTTTPPAVPEWGADPIVRTVADASAPLAVPRDLAFHPDHPDELFVVNRATDSVTVLFDPDTADQTAEVYDDAYGDHFMEEVSSLAFGDTTTVPNEDPVSTFATCQESRNTYDDTAPPNDFMGPSLWPADLDIFAQVHQHDDLLGSHLDMLHQSPLCMGIAHESANAYWVFDGMHAEIVYYDFQQPHGYGEEDHTDGIVRTYPEADVLRVPDVPSHLELDPDSGLLYVADTGHGRVLWWTRAPAAWRTRCRGSATARSSRSTRRWAASTCRCWWRACRSRRGWWAWCGVFSGSTVIPQTGSTTEGIAAPTPQGYHGASE